MKIYKLLEEIKDPNKWENMYIVGKFSTTC